MRVITTWMHIKILKISKHMCYQSYLKTLIDFFKIGVIFKNDSLWIDAHTFTNEGVQQVVVRTEHNAGLLH